MKVDVYPHHSPHQDIMDKKPLHDNEEQNLYHHSSLTPQSPDCYHTRLPEHVSPSDNSTNWTGQPYVMQNQQPRQIPSPFYGQGAMYSTQMHPHAYYPNSHNWYPTAAPMLPSMGPYYVHPHPSPPPGPPPPSMPHYQSLDSRGSISSSHSSDTFGGGSSSAKRRHGSGRRNRRGSRHGGGGGGSPPNRGWYRYDVNTTCFQMRGRIVEIAKDRDGSKFIQRRLHVADLSEMQLIFDEAVNDIEEIWDDVYGNYILQGLLELGTDDIKAWIGKRIIESGTVSLSTKVYGCRLVQKALDTLDKESVANMVASIKGKVWLLVHDHNGNHVIQKSVTKINDFVQESQDQEDDPTTALLLGSLDIIIEEVTDNIKDLAIHPYGCRVVQRLLEHCSGSQKTAVLDSIVLEDLVSNLINHEYGNYVIQRVLAYGRKSDKAAVFETVSSHNNVLKLSKQKHSSNVVEMLISYGNSAQRHQIVEEILNCFCVDQNYVQKSAAVSMAEDNYANYVLKTALDVLEDGPQRKRLFTMLLSSLGDLEKSQYAKQIVVRVKAYAQQDSNYE